MAKDIDWKNLTFRLTPTQTMYVAKTNLSHEWEEGQYIPYGPISLSPAAGVLNYGQGVYEGLKAHRTPDGRIILFRPEKNAERFQQGAKRLCMPPISIKQFINTVVQIVQENREYVPPLGMGSLYVRPCLWGSGAVLGMAAAPEYSFVVYASPVGNYFGGGKIVPVKFLVSEAYNRSVRKGTGNIKCIGNYAATLLPTSLAKGEGYMGTIFLDAIEETYIEEAGVANFFCIKNNKLLTPKLNECILSGVTRESIIHLAREVLGLEVLEIPLSIKTALDADECFCSGTATVVTPIGSITYQGQEKVYNEASVGPWTQKLYELLLGIQQGVIEDPFKWTMDIDQFQEITADLVEA